MIIVYRDRDKFKNFTIIGKRKNGGGGGLPEVAENEDILAIKNVDTVEGIVFMNNPNNISIQYSTNGSEFNDYTTATEVPIGVGEKVYFKWSEVISNSSNNTTALVSSTIKYNVYGELKQGNNQYAYRSMFYNETNLIDASELKLIAPILADFCYYAMFHNCTSLTTTPALPSTNLAEGCYRSMFYNCSSLTTTPLLSSTDLKVYCYQQMFRGCTSLTTAPALPSTNLAEGCYRSMFYDCTSLTTAPLLSSTDLKSECYRTMFRGCTSLTTAPALPSTNLADYCYYGMFALCTSLTTAPALPSTNLKDYCYSAMFENCSSLTTAPALPSTDLKAYCYQQMFSGCTSLNYVKHHITDWNELYTLYWLRDVASSGIVECPADSTIPSGSMNGIPNGWTRVNIPEPDYTDYTDMLYFAPRTYTTNVQVKISEDCIVDEFKYTTTPLFNTDIKSLNYDELDYPTVSKGSTIEINSLSGTSILWKGALRNNSSVDTPIFEIITDTEENNEVQVAGDLNNGSFDYAYYYMFNGNTALSYIGTGLVLTAEYVGRSAYQNMFFNCSNFDDGGDIHISAKVVKPYGLGAMFSGCTSLRTAPYLNVKQVDDWGMAYMFANTAITTAPEIKITKLSYYCFKNTFEGCLNLNYVKHHITDWNELYTENWLKDVASEGTMYCPLNSTIPSNSVSGLPSGWLRVNIE